MRNGGEVFFATLSTYLAHFAGRTGLPLTVFGPPVADWPSTWRRLTETFGLAGAPAVGDRVAFEPDGLPPVDGEVFVANSQTIGVRTDDAIYRFIEGFHGPLIACHSVFTPGFTETDRDAAEQAWQSWLTKTLS
jgi:hypothetical protein